MVAPLLAAGQDEKLLTVHTIHYNIHTDLDDALVADLASRMDVMYDQYVRTFSEFKPPALAPPLAVYLFTTREKYMAFTDYAGVNTGGMFFAGRRNCLTAYEQGQGRDALRRTLQHEAFHQFAHLCISRHLPPWMNEGMAQLFEESIWIGKDFLTDQIPPRRLRQLNADILQKRLIDFDKMLALTPGDWKTTLHTDLQKATTAYNQAWAMAYFCSAAGDQAYHARFMQLLHKLHDENTSVTAATRECFPDLKDFRKQFNIWAAKVQPTPQATLRERQETLADFLLAITQHNHPAPVDMTAFRNLAVEFNLKIQYTTGTLSYSTAADPLIYFSDLSGTLFKPEELFLESDNAAPLPDIVCQPKGGGYRYRTRFYISAGRTEHEVWIEKRTDETKKG